MSDVVSTKEKEKCCGCGACAYVCPVKAISYQMDEEGFSYPVVDASVCIHCGKCLSYCPLQSGKKPEAKPVINRYGAKRKDLVSRLNSRSGGVFVSLSDEIFARGGSVYGAVLTGDHKVCHSRATKKEERDPMCGSKYVQSDMGDIFSLLQEDFKQKKPVLFSGTPCQVAAVSNVFPEEQYPNLYLCDCICHGVPSPGFLQGYLDWAKEQYKGELVSFAFRDKKEHPWDSHVEKLDFGGRVIYSRRYTNLFYANQCLRESCYACPYASAERISDFTLGDYWGIEKVRPEFDDKKGISLLLIRTEKGRELFEKASQSMEIFDASAFEPIHYNLKRPTKRPQDREAFWKDYQEKGFSYVSQKYGGYDLLRRIKRRILEGLR